MSPRRISQPHYRSHHLYAESYHSESESCRPDADGKGEENEMESRRRWWRYLRFLVSLFEKYFAKKAYSSLCVTKSMQQWLAQNWVQQWLAQNWGVKCVLM